MVRYGRWFVTLIKSEIWTFLFFSSPFRVWSPGWHRVGNMSKSRQWIAEPTLVDRGQQRVRATPQRAIQPTASTTRGELLCSHERQRKTHCKSAAYQRNLHITERGLKIGMHVFGQLNVPLLLSSPVSIERISEMNDWFSCCTMLQSQVYHSPSCEVELLTLLSHQRWHWKTLWLFSELLCYLLCFQAR